MIFHFESISQGFFFIYGTLAVASCQGDQGNTEAGYMYNKIFQNENHDENDENEKICEKTCDENEKILFRGYIK